MTLVHSQSVVWISTMSMSLKRGRPAHDSKISPFFKHHWKYRVLQSHFPCLTAAVSGSFLGCPFTVQVLKIQKKHNSSIKKSKTDLIQLQCKALLYLSWSWIWKEPGLIFFLFFYFFNFFYYVFFFFFSFLFFSFLFTFWDFRIKRSLYLSHNLQPKLLSFERDL